MVQDQISNEDIFRFLRNYGDLNKFDLVTKIISYYDSKSYFAKRKVWVKKTRGELLITIWEIESKEFENDNKN